MELTPEEQKQNLKELAKYLYNLGETYEGFHMSHYMTDIGEKSLNPPDATGKDFHICGAVGCAVGHGPQVKTIKQPKFSPSWNQYCEQAFGIPVVFIHESLPAFAWCFDSDWSNMDNTPQGAALRIMGYLDDFMLSDELIFSVICHNEGDEKEFLLEYGAWKTEAVVKYDSILTNNNVLQGD